MSFDFGFWVDVLYISSKPSNFLFLGYLT